MEKIIDYLPGQTPLHLDELAELIPSHITFRCELNEFELVNITQAVQKYLFGKKRNWNLADVEVLKRIHLDMLGETWKWAGKYRKRDTNIGCDWRQIQVLVKNACGDFEYWIQKNTFSPSETAVRFHHKLVSIHPFPNGNGRHGRIVADIHMHQSGKKPLPWGGGDLTTDGANRQRYLDAMRQADQGEFSALLKFAQSV